MISDSRTCQAVCPNGNRSIAILSLGKSGPRSRKSAQVCKLSGILSAGPEDICRGWQVRPRDVISQSGRRPARSRLPGSTLVSSAATWCMRRRFGVDHRPSKGAISLAKRCFEKLMQPVMQRSAHYPQFPAKSSNCWRIANPPSSVRLRPAPFGETANPATTYGKRCRVLLLEVKHSDTQTREGGRRSDPPVAGEARVRTYSAIEWLQSFEE